MFEVNRQNVEALLDSGKLFTAMRNGSWWRIRRNGRTQTWKLDATRVRIPIKAGLRSYGAITETDFQDGRLNVAYYRHEQDVPAKPR